MSNVVRQGVEGIGITPFEALPILTEDSCFTQVAIPETVKIPDIKPDMEELLSVMVEAKIVSLRIIKTPVGTSQEGQHLTGRKLSIELELNQKVKYIADEPSQSVHSAHFTKKVSSIWVVVPEKVKDKNGNDINIETLLAQGKLIVTPYIEDIYGEQLDKRTIFKNISVLINVHCNYCCGEAALKLTKSATPDPVKDGGKLTYTVIIENTGTATATNINFSDLLSATGGITAVYVTDSFKVDGVVKTGANPFTPAGVNIDSIATCKTVKLEYAVTVTVPAAGTITNAAKATYTLSPCKPGTDTVTTTITTNGTP